VGAAKMLAVPGLLHAAPAAEKKMRIRIIYSLHGPKQNRPEAEQARLAE